MIQAVVLSLMVAAAPLPDDAVKVSAKIDAGQLEVGKTYEIQLSVDIDDAYSVSRAGIPAPFVQIDVPKSVQLEGKVLETYKELSKNEFLQKPFEQLIDANPQKIAFKLLAQPGPDDHFTLNVTAYLTKDPKENGWFVRRPLILPVKGGATAAPGDANRSNWGRDEKLLQIGDQAAAFDLPTADGKKIALDTYLGKKNIIVLTYRAFW
jgi:hypothetical protein